MTTDTLTPIAPTPASAWRKARDGALYVLPGSGNVARLVRPSLTALAGTANGVPNPLSRAVLMLMAAPPPKNDDERIENVRRNSRAMVEVAALCLVDPVLVLDDEPGDGQIGPSDLSNLDYAWLYYTFVEGAAADAARFRVGGGPEAS